jgi:hypothetical protein
MAEKQVTLLAALLPYTRRGKYLVIQVAWLEQNYSNRTALVMLA